MKHSRKLKDPRWFKDGKPWRYPFIGPGGNGEKVVDPQEIKQRFASAGWELDEGFSGHLVIGCSGDSTLSIVAHPEEVFESAEDPLFEILDHVHYVNHWVREIPTPSQAAQMLREHGEPPEEEEEE